MFKWSMWNLKKGFDVTTRVSKLKSSAKARGISINLDINKYQMMIDMGCHYCGSDLSNEKGYCLDRVDSSKGYIISNIVGCCKICNIAKSNMDVFEFVRWLKRAYTHTMAALEMINNQPPFDYDPTEEAVRVMNEATKDLPKRRIKLVCSNE